mgnify:CR=1 FL=1
MAQTQDNRPKEQQLVVFAIKNEEFGVDITQVKEIVKLLEVTYVPKAPSFIEGVINLRGSIVAIVDLAKRLGLETSSRDDSTRIIVVEIGNNLVGMIVDSVSEVLRLPSEFVEDVPSLVDTEVPEHYIRGVGKLQDRLLVLLDLNRILTPEEFQHVEKHIKGASPKINND